MSCKALKLKGCEIKGSTFQGRKFTFPNRDISSDVFTLKIPKLNIEKEGVVNQNDVYFSYSDFEPFKEGLYAVEFWANFEGIGNELIAEETFVISLTSCGGGSISNNTTFNLEFPEETIDYSVEYAVINIYDTGGTVTWENVTGKPAIFYDDTEIKEEIDEKVDKVDGYGLSQNNYTTADKTKLDNINLSNYVLQTSLNSQLTSYVLQSNLNTQLQSYATLNGVQTFNSTITFAQAPIVPTATLNGHAVNLGQLNAGYVSYGVNRMVNVGKLNNNSNVIERLNVGRFYDLLSINNVNIFTYQTEYWNGTSWVVFGSPAINIGNSAGINNVGATVINVGLFSGSNNRGTNVINSGSNAGQNNLGNSVINNGTNSGTFNVGAGVVNNGINTGYQATGTSLISIGNNTNYYTQGTNVIVLGAISNSTFKDNVAGNKMFDSSAIDVTAKTISIPNHGFGSANAYVNLKFTQGSSSITGITNGNIIQVKIIDSNTLLFSELLSTGQYRHTHNITNTGTGIGHILTPQFNYGNINIFGSNLEPTKSNQNIISGGEFLMPQSTIATLRADTTNKTLITKEFFNAEPKTFVPATASSIANNTMFVDSADGKLKFKDGNGVLNNLY